MAQLEPATKQGMKVGVLAKRTGVSVRTLHYYDEVGLLSPSGRTEAGYRLYTDDDIVRLQQIKSLQQLGFSLQEIRSCLDGLDFSPQQVIEMHVRALSGQIESRKSVRSRLRAIAAGLRSHERVSVEQFIRAIEEINKMEKHYTPEQTQFIKERAELLGEAHIREVEAEWPALIEQVRAEIDRGTDPTDERVQMLANRWRELVNEFTGGNAEIEGALRKGYQEDPTWGRPDMDPRMLEYMQYISQAWAASNKAG